MWEHCSEEENVCAALQQGKPSAHGASWNAHSLLPRHFQRGWFSSWDPDNAFGTIMVHICRGRGRGGGGIKKVLFRKLTFLLLKTAYSGMVYGKYSGILHWEFSGMLNA